MNIRKPILVAGNSGMTLIETLVAITILSVAIVAPMSLTMFSLTSAYYARDQIVASNLAQEAIEAVRAVRDGNILRIALNDPELACNPTNLLCNIPIGQDFRIDSRITNPSAAITVCDGACPNLQTDPTQTMYGYDAGWSDTIFRRTLRAEFVDGAQNEIRLTVTVARDGGLRSFPPVILKENLYRWVEDGSGI